MRRTGENQTENLRFEGGTDWPRVESENQTFSARGGSGGKWPVLFVRFGLCPDPIAANVVLCASRLLAHIPNRNPLRSLMRETYYYII